MTGLVRADTELMLRAAQEMQRTSIALLEQFAAAQQAMQSLQSTPWSGNHRTAIEEHWMAINAKFQPTTSSLDDIALRLKRTAEAMDAAALSFGDSTAIPSAGSFLADLGAKLGDLSAAELLLLGLSASGPVGLLTALPYTPWGQALLHAGQGTYDPAFGAADTALPGDGPPPRYIYVNGIGSSAVPGEPDPSGNRLKEAFAKAKYDPEQLQLVPAVYNTDWQTHYASDDWWGLGSAINGVTGAFNTTFGATQVVREYMQGENGPYTKQSMQWIMQDLEDNPLLPGQKVILVGHSGGGAVVANLTGMLEQQNVDVQAVVTMGSPVANYDQAAQYADVHQIRDQDDMIGLPIIRSSESTGIAVNGGNPLVSLVGNELLVRDSSPNITHTTTYSRDTRLPTETPHSSYHSNPAVMDVHGQYYTGHNQNIPAGASASGAAR